MRTFRSVLPLLAALLWACAADTDLYPQPVSVVYYGDSLVNQSGDRLQKLLPSGSTVENLGKDAQMAQHAVNGSYGSINYSHDKIYVLAWGMNEALQSRPSSQLQGDLNHIITELKLRGKTIVLEAPPMSTGYDGTVSTAPMIEAVTNLAKQHGLPIAKQVVRMDFVDGVHPTSEHYDERAKALADAVTSK